MATIVETLHDLSHEVDREPLDVVFLIRIKGKDRRVRSQQVTVSTTYEQLAWHKKRVTQCAEAQAKDRRAPGESFQATDFCVEALRHEDAERKLAQVNGFRGTPVPGFYNPVHSTFLGYAEHWIDGQMFLASQKSTFFRYCKVPEHLWSRRTDDARLQVLVI